MSFLAAALRVLDSPDPYCFNTCVFLTLYALRECHGPGSSDSMFMFCEY